MDTGNMAKAWSLQAVILVQIVLFEWNSSHPLWISISIMKGACWCRVCIQRVLVESPRSTVGFGEGCLEWMGAPVRHLRPLLDLLRGPSESIRNDNSLQSQPRDLE